MECRVRPLRGGDEALLARFEPFFAAPRFELASFDRGVFDRAAQLRATLRLKTPDALHAAAALTSGCDEIWTNDRRLAVLEPALRVVVVSSAVTAAERGRTPVLNRPHARASRATRRASRALLPLAKEHAFPAVVRMRSAGETRRTAPATVEWWTGPGAGARREGAPSTRGSRHMKSDVVTLRPEAPPTPEKIRERMGLVADAVERVVRGKRPVIEQMLAGVLAQGHLLLEDVPGVGKTTLAQALARALGLSFSRVQVTSDLLPSDILGVTTFDQAKGAFEFRPGPIFAHVVLADEVNRTTPRTQSALLEAMSEAQVSLDGRTHPLPHPFLLLATQNPREHAGTYPLPESQLDRFLLRLEVGYPAKDVEREILVSGGGDEPLKSIRAVTDAAEVARMQAARALVRVEASVADYAMRIVEATRESPLVGLGVSTRGALAFLRAAQGRALLDGRGFVLPDDLKAVAVPCLSHRIVPAGREAEEMDRREAARLVRDLLERVAVPQP